MTTNRLINFSFYLALTYIFATGFSQIASAAQVQDPHRPPAINAQEVPPLPNEIFQKLEKYQNIRGASFAGWAPDGKGILISTRFGNASQLHRVYQPGSRRQQLTFFKEPVSGGFVPGKNSNALLLSSSKGGNENYQIYLSDQKRFKTTLLTDGKSRNEIGPVSEDGTKMIVHSNRRNGRDTDLYIADVHHANTMKMIFKTNKQYWFAEDWSPDEKTLIIIRYVSINESYLALLDMKTGKKTDIPLGGTGKVSINTAKFATNGKSLYLTTDLRGEFLELAQLDLKTKKLKWLSKEIPWDVRNLEMDRQSKRLAFVTNENGASKLYVIDDEKRKPINLPLGIIRGIEFSPDGKQIGLSLSRPDGPTDAYSVTLDGKLTRWTFSETGGLNPKRFVRPKLIHYQSFDGRKIPAYYYQPRNAVKGKPVPVVIKIHGGPESQFRPYFSSSTQYYVNELSIAVICPNVRGSAGYGKTYLQLDNGPKREESVKDIGTLLDWIAKQPELDEKRVCVAGGSYGGYMVLASLTHFPDRIKAGIDIVGIANFISFLERTAAYRRDLRRAEYGDERDPAMRKVFERINPTANAHKIRSALLVAHGVNDPRVPFYEAQQIAKKVRQLKLPVWTVYAKNEGHGFRKKNNRDYLTAVQVLFLKKHLLAD